jgi:murein peptide amidase A
LSAISWQRELNFVRAIIPAGIAATPAPAKVFRGSAGAIQRFLAPLLDTAENSDWLVAGSVGELFAGRTRFHIPRFIFLGPGGGGDTVRLGIFAGVHGDDYSGTKAILSFLQQLESHPDLAKGYHIFAYPICNPSGFARGIRCNAAGHDLTSHFWNGSDQPEAYYLERELGVHRFHGVIVLEAGDQSNLRFFVTGGKNSTLRNSLASPFVPADQIFVADASPSPATAKGFLTMTNELRPVPFEIDIEIPRAAPKEKKIIVTINALDSILDSYRSVIAIQQNL